MHFAFSRIIFFSNKMLYKNFYKTLSPPQKTATLVQILFRATHTYSKDSKKRCLVNWSKNRAALGPLATKIRHLCNIRSVKFRDSRIIQGIFFNFRKIVGRLVYKPQEMKTFGEQYKVKCHCPEL